MKDTGKDLTMYCADTRGLVLPRGIAALNGGQPPATIPVTAPETVTVAPVTTASTTSGDENS